MPSAPPSAPAPPFAGPPGSRPTPKTAATRTATEARPAADSRRFAGARPPAAAACGCETPTCRRTTPIPPGEVSMPRGAPTCPPPARGAVPRPGPGAVLRPGLGAVPQYARGLCSGITRRLVQQPGGPLGEEGLGRFMGQGTGLG